MSKDFTHSNIDFKYSDCKNKDSENLFYYYYRSETEKQELHNLFCSNIQIFYDRVCLYEKNKDNPNCQDLSGYLKDICCSKHFYKNI